MTSERLQIVLTGATGFVGRALAEEWVGRHRLVCLTRRPVSLSGCEEIYGELLPQTMRLLPRRADVVVHLAAVTAPPPEAGLEVLRGNVLATRLLAEYADSSGALFVYASSGSVYPRRDQPWSEEESGVPDDVNGALKQAGEYAANLPEAASSTLILRLFHPYGAAQADRFLIPRLVKRVVGGETVNLNDDGSPWFSCIYIADLVRVLSRLVSERATGIFNVAEPQPHSIGELIALAERKTNRRAQRQVNRRREGSVIADVGLLQKRLPAERFTDLGSGLDHLLCTLTRDAAAMK